MLTSFDVIILGAGAAGLMCAIEAGKRGKTVLVLERNSKIAEKIRISGGGRCNFTNVNANHNHYLSDNAHFCKSALAQFTPADFIALLELYDIPYHEKKLGQLFCNRSASDVIGVLRDECDRFNVELVTNRSVTTVSREEDSFTVLTDEESYKARSVVVATGGISIPKLGATDIGYRIAKQFDIACSAPKPGLVPFVCGTNEAQLCNELSGISLDAIVSCNKKTFRENILFTHKGLSGPAILQISSYWNPGDVVQINCSPEVDILALLKEYHQTKKEHVTILAEVFPKRFAQLWCERYVETKIMNQFSNAQLSEIANRLHKWEIIPAGTEGFSKAEVTVGGVDTNELSSKTMEAKKVPRLFFIGEVVDVTGELGGYNFQWAWASGFVAGKWV